MYPYCKSVLIDCRASIFAIDATALIFAAFGQGTGPIHLDDVQCRGFEDALLNCSYDSNTADCIHVEDASVRCRRK